MAKGKKARRSSKKRSASQNVKKSWFPRREDVEELRSWGDQRWRKAAKKDLEDLIEDEAGLDRLAQAIKAILRSGESGR